MQITTLEKEATGLPAATSFKHVSPDRYGSRTSS